LMDEEGSVKLVFAREREVSVVFDDRDVKISQIAEPVNGFRLRTKTNKNK